MANPNPRTSNRSDQQARSRAALANMLLIQSDRYSARRNADSEDASRMGDTELSDDSISASGERSKPSVLDLGTRSYAEPESDEAGIMGGGFQEGTTSSITRTRQLQEAMMQRQSQFVGSETEARRQAERAQRIELQPEELQGEAEDEEDVSEEDRAQQLMQDKAQQLRQQGEKKAQEQSAKERAKQIQDQLKRKMNRATKSASRITMEGAEVAGSEVIIPLLLLIAQLNVQMIMKYFFKPMLLDGRFGNSADQAMDGAPWIDQSFIEDIITINVDILLTCVGVCCNPCCMPFTLLLLISYAIIHPF